MANDLGRSPSTEDIDWVEVSSTELKNEVDDNDNHWTIGRWLVTFFVFSTMPNIGTQLHWVYFRKIVIHDVYPYVVAELW